MQWLFGDDGLSQQIISCCARLKTSTLFEDKVTSLNELENLAKDHPLVCVFLYIVHMIYRLNDVVHSELNLCVTILKISTSI